MSQCRVSRAQDLRDRDYAWSRATEDWQFDDLKPLSIREQLLLEWYEFTDVLLTIRVTLFWPVIRWWRLRHLRRIHVAR